MVVQLYALVDAALAPAAAYVAAGKLTKQAWLAILAVAVVVVLLSGWFGPLGLAAIIATIVYFVDVQARAAAGSRQVARSPGAGVQL